MKRILNHSLPGYTCPEGNVDGGAFPHYGYQPDYNAFVEKTSKTRSIAEIMGFYDVKTFLLGPFPGELFNLGVMTSKPHTTHITYYKPKKDSLWDSCDISNLVPDNLAGTLKVITVADTVADIGIDVVKSADISKGDIVFFSTGISTKYRKEYPSKEYYSQYPGMTFEAAEYLVDKEIKVVGIDAWTIEPMDPAKRGSISISNLFNSAGIPVIEDLADLSSVKGGLTWAFIGIPVKIRGAIGAAARVVAVNPENPNEYTDLSNKIKTYPNHFIDRKQGWELPLPARIEPRDMQNQISRWSRLIPFKLEGEDLRTPDKTSQEMYIYFSHATNTHAECAYFNPFNEHQISDEIMCRYKEMPLDRMIGNATLMDLSDKIGPRQTIDVDVLEASNTDIRKDDILFVRTDINDWYLFGKSIDITPGFTVSASRWLVDRGIKALVIDFPSVEKSNPPSGVDGIRYTSNKVHYFLHKNDIPVVEKVTKMAYIKQNRFNAALLPLPAHNLGGFPVDIFTWENW